MADLLLRQSTFPRWCVVCGAQVQAHDSTPHGRLPETCRRDHGNVTSEGYRTIVADPPWAYDEGWPAGSTSPNSQAGCRDRTGRKPLAYDAMTLDAIKALAIEALAADDAHLLLWTTNRYVRASYEVAEAWGFRPSQLLTWCKPTMGLGPGGVFSNTSEFCLYARRGKPEHLTRQDSTWWLWPRVTHSVKPEAFLDKVEATFPGPYVELFARRARFGWDYWGDQSLGTTEVAA